MSGTWEAPWFPSATRAGCTNAINGGHPMDHGESDHSTVLGGGRADHMGKGVTGLRSPQRKHELVMKDWSISCKPHCGG